MGKTSHQYEAGYPLGGALKFTQVIESRYLCLGGELYCSSPVKEILVENNKAVGVCLYDGTEHRSNYHSVVHSILDRTMEMNSPSSYLSKPLITLKLSSNLTLLES